MDPSSIDVDGANDERANLPPMTLPQHRLARYLRVRLEVDHGVLQWVRPRTLAGLVPVGTRQMSLPIWEVRSLRLHRASLRPARLFTGLALVVVPFAALRWWMALPGAVVGVWVIVVSLGPRLEVVTRTGERHEAAVCVGHQLDAGLFIDAVQDLIGSRDEEE